MTTSIMDLSVMGHWIETLEHPPDSSYIDAVFNKYPESLYRYYFPDGEVADHIWFELLHTETPVGEFFNYNIKSVGADEKEWFQVMGKRPAQRTFDKLDRLTEEISPEVGLDAPLDAYAGAQLLTQAHRQAQDQTQAPAQAQPSTSEPPTVSYINRGVTWLCSAWDNLHLNQPTEQDNEMQIEY